MCGNCSTPGGDPAPICKCGEWGEACACDFKDADGNQKRPENCSRCGHVPTYSS